MNCYKETVSTPPKMGHDSLVSSPPARRAMLELPFPCAQQGVLGAALSPKSLVIILIFFHYQLSAAHANYMRKYLDTTSMRNGIRLE